MGIFDRFRPVHASQGRTYEAERVEPSEDEQALARYRYMLKTAPPEAIEQAHVEAFARLSAQQRRMLLEQLRTEMPEAERAYATERPEALARLATRAEVRQPGTMERLFSRVPAAGPGLGGIMAGSLFGSMAGTVLGTVIAQNFLASHGPAHGDLSQGHATGLDHDVGRTHDAAAGDPAGGIDHDIGSDFDGPSFDV